MPVQNFQFSQTQITLWNALATQLASLISRTIIVYIVYIYMLGVNVDQTISLSGALQFSILTIGTDLNE
jgi:hypothetical protein